jgi:hypothetical protein
VKLELKLPNVKPRVSSSWGLDASCPASCFLMLLLSAAHPARQAHRSHQPGKALQLFILVSSGVVTSGVLSFLKNRRTWCFLRRPPCIRAARNTG